MSFYCINAQSGLIASTVSFPKVINPYLRIIPFKILSSHLLAISVSCLCNSPFIFAIKKVGFCFLKLRFGILRFSFGFALTREMFLLFGKNEFIKFKLAKKGEYKIITSSFFVYAMQPCVY